MLEDFTQWILDLIGKLFKAAWDFVSDAFVALVSTALEAFLDLLGMVPVPEFVSSGLQGLMAGIGGDALWLLGMVNLPGALAIYGAGVAFRLARKALTLGQW